MGDLLQNLEAEAILLGRAMIENDVIDVVREILAPEDFGFDLHCRIWSAISRERDAGRHVTPIALHGYFEADPQMEQSGGFAYLARLTGNEVCLIVPAQQVAHQIKDLATRRRLRAGLMEAAGSCADIETAVPEIVSAVDAVIRAPTDETARQATAGECMDDLIASFDVPHAGVTSGIISSLDSLWGKLRPGSMTVLAARPGMGKTAVALTFARGAAEQGHGVMFFSHEMSGAELAGRMAADVCFDRGAPNRVPYSAIRDRELGADQRRSVQQARCHVGSLSMSIVDAGSVTIGRLRAMVRGQKRRMAARGVNLGLVIVDYLQLVRPDGQMRSTYEAVSEVSRGMKALAMDEQVAVLALAQLSRSVENRVDKRPILSDLRESGQIEQDADAVLFLLRDEYYLRQNEPDAGRGSDEHASWQSALQRTEGVIEFILAKCRNGSPGTARGRFYAPFQAVRSE